MRLALAAYVVGVGLATALVAYRKGRDPRVWLVGGFAGGIPLFLLALLAPRAGQPWRSRAFVAVAMFGAIVLAVVLAIIAISEANLTF
jgi:hypothetical protein